MKDKVLTIIITHNNPALLEHMFESMDKHDPGYDNDILVVDATSDDPNQLKLLDKLSKKNNIRVETCTDNRVEANYNVAWKNNRDYRYYFFSHDDMRIRVDNWLKAFIARMDSGYYEESIKNSHLTKFPIGKVGAGTQFWRDYTNVLGHPVQCLFLKYALGVLRPGKVPEIFKYCDGDRVLISRECIEKTQGFRHVGEFLDLKVEDKEKYNELVEVLNKYLSYPDIGTYPSDLYPAGECWAKFSLLGEFMSSTDPLIEGFRTVGLKDDGYLEQLHGFATPMQHDHITHYGSPNCREFLGKVFGTGREDVKKHFNNKVFLMKCDKVLREYFAAENKGKDE